MIDVSFLLTIDFSLIRFDIGSLKTNLFWPSERMVFKGRDKKLALKIADLYKGYLQGIALRGELHIGLTGGYFKYRFAERVLDECLREALPICYGLNSMGFYQMEQDNAPWGL